MQDKRKWERPFGLLVVTAAALLPIASGSDAAEGPSPTAAAGSQATGTTVLSLEGKDWVVAADPGNGGRAAAWWESPRPGARPIRVPGILQEALPGYHGVAWYWRQFTPPQNPYPGGRCLLRFHAVDYLADVWLNDVPVGGHEGGETPFVLDITDAVRIGAPNRLAVRVLNPTAEPIDGIVLAETPHRNKTPAGITAGASYNSGGITEPVEVFWVPAARIEDVYVRPDWKTGQVTIQATVVNAGKSTADAELHFAIAPALGTEPVAALTVEEKLPPGEKRVACELAVTGHRLWQ
ncbi:MAG: hypothetical protein PHN77_19745, partial [Thermoguttaceae bacterium]|nr:hypothetical protein [Thermoguttaceae bacterium]